MTEPNKDIQKLLKPSSSGDLSKELFQHPAGGQEEAEGGLSGHAASLLHITEKRREYLERGEGKVVQDDKTVITSNMDGQGFASSIKGNFLSRV